MSALLDHELETEHLEWMLNHVDPIACKGHSREVVAKMADAFPELKAQAGFYICPTAGKFPHWWLTDADGRIIDPTRSQFPSEGLFLYESLARSPSGQCLSCARYVYDNRMLCSDDCRDDMAALIEMFGQANARR